MLVFWEALHFLLFATHYFSAVAQWVTFIQQGAEELYKNMRISKQQSFPSENQLKLDYEEVI